MDRLVELIVRLISACAGWAHVLPGVEYAQHAPGEPLKILLVGYNGARNTGSDVRVGALAHQLEDLMGRDNIRISVMSLDAESTSVYFDERVKQIEFSSLFFGDLFKACSEHHAAILCEGSTFKSKFADALTLYSCEAAGVMRAQDKPCIAYGSEVGEMESYLKRAMQSLCTDVRYAVRSSGSLVELNKLGFEGFLGTDTAWRFDSSRAHDEVYANLRGKGWDGKRPLLGIAPVNPFCWPVRPSVKQYVQALVSGNRKMQFQSWYFFSWSEQRKHAFHAYLDALAQACMTFAAERGFQPVIIGMEQLDAEACTLLNKRFAADCPIFLSSEYDGFFLTELLRSLGLLVTSRYHAQVLATGSFVPAVAVSMDERLDNLSDELGTSKEMLLHVDDPDLAPRLLLALDYAQDNVEEVRGQLSVAYQDVCNRLDRMGSWLGAQLADI